MGLKHREGSGPGGCGAGAEHSTPVPLLLEPSRGCSLPVDKGLHYLCSACQRSSAATAGQRGRQPARAGAARSRAGCCGHPGGFCREAGRTRLYFTPLSSRKPLSPFSSPLQRQHPSPSPALAPRGMWSHRGGGEWGSGMPQHLSPAPGHRPGAIRPLRGRWHPPGKPVLLPAREYLTAAPRWPRATLGSGARGAAGLGPVAGGWWDAGLCPPPHTRTNLRVLPAHPGSAPKPLVSPCRTL